MGIFFIKKLIFPSWFFPKSIRIDLEFYGDQDDKFKITPSFGGGFKYTLTRAVITTTNNATLQNIPILPKIIVLLFLPKGRTKAYL